MELYLSLLQFITKWWSDGLTELKELWWLGWVRNKLVDCCSVVTICMSVHLVGALTDNIKLVVVHWPKCLVIKGYVSCEEIMVKQGDSYHDKLATT